MSNHEAMTSIVNYLKVHNLQYTFDFDNGVERISMAFPGYPIVPGKIIEACIFFYSSGMEARVYYSETGAAICRENSERIPGLYRLLNYINARVWMSSGDYRGELYQSDILYTPRLYLTEDDGFDITITTMIYYDFMELAPIETIDYITVFCPELLNRLSPMISGVLLGTLTVDAAISHIKQNISDEV